MQSMTINPDKIIAKLDGVFWDVNTIDITSKIVEIERNGEIKKVKFNDVEISVMSTGWLPTHNLLEFTSTGFTVEAYPTHKKR